MSAINDILKDEVLIFLDLETTGLNFNTDKIIEIGALKVKNGQIAERYHQLINPQIPLPAFISHLTSIKQDDLTDKKTIEEAGGHFFDFLNTHLLICHNADFEKGFLTAIKKSAPKNEFVDTCELSALLYPDLISYRLESLLEFFKIKTSEAHRALIDAEDTFSLWQSLFLNLNKYDWERLELINNILLKTSLPVGRIFADLVKHREFFMEPALAQTRDSLSGILNRPQPFALSKGAVLGCGCIKKTPPTNSSQDIQTRTDVRQKHFFFNEKELSDLNIFRKIFDGQGPAAEILKDYDAIEEQTALAELTAKALNEKEFLIIETASWIKKPLTYIFPSLIFSFKNTERIVFSCSSRELQQLITRAIPLAKEKLNIHLNTAVLNNLDSYLCLKNLNKLLEKGEFFNDEAKFALAYVVSLNSKSREACLSDISHFLLEKNKYLKDFKEFLGLQNSFCLKEKCSYFQECLYQQNLRDIEKADILIVSQVTLFSQSNLIPNYNYLILDEADNLEQTAASVFTKILDSEQLCSFLNMFLEDEKKQFKKDNLIDLPSVKPLENQAAQAKTCLLNFSNTLADICEQDKNWQKFYKPIKNIKEIEKETSFPKVKKNCLDLITAMQEMIKTFFSLSQDGSLEFEDRLKMSVLAEKTEEKAHLLKDMFFLEKEASIRRFEFYRNNGLKNFENFSWKFLSTPLNRGRLLAEAVFGKLKSAVLIGCALNLGDNFSFFSQRTGLSLVKENILRCEYIKPSQKHKKNTVLEVPQNFPHFSYENDSVYNSALQNEIKEIILAKRGKILVFFTSKKRMQETYAQLKEPLKLKGVVSLCQDIDGQKQLLIKQLQRIQTDTAVFASIKYFQEGFYVRGINTVILDKLPFPNRNDPVISAEREAVIKMGGSPFANYELPLAILALKQGLNKFKRSPKDSVLFVILDRRLLERNYNRTITKALPQVKITAISKPR